ncbi:ABC-type metal ion transport system, periplasmic component/surface adhesin [Cylindrospermum stagnale PCC 7417]|uniref:ABC-type metal ion transport system, periplasmic component/surface adhesin n=1 Tax=Cylindrospermum stagnale PCC 7417 TaxID=56107 RepID=K9X5H5_9NOST|nr:metal ABC transporter substrate-binding protein [Cylindrospermum stagnale]AFZ26897.1 ABC-type metal ion transport system, periplasmic component/surface adhesin [Cylindrospermum stagnale PCC 7417]
MIWNPVRISVYRQRSGNGILTLITLLLLSIASGCKESNSNQGINTEKATPAQEAASTPARQKTKVVTTFLPVYLFTKAVAGDVADVEILVPPGTEVHDYQATPDNVKAIATANVLVKNGLGLEEFLEGTVKNAQNSKLTEIDASQGIKALNQTSPVEKTATEEEDHDHADGNPHVWLDPVLAKQQVVNIRDGLIAADPANKATYEANSAAYIQELESLNNEFEQTLQKTPNCTFVTFHDAFPYLAQRYKLKQVAVVEIPEDQLSPKDVQNAVNAVKKYKVKALFSEPGVDNKLLKSLSQDLNLSLRTLDSVETGKTDPQYYFQVMKANLQTLAAACQ